MRCKRPTVIISELFRGRAEPSSLHDCLHRSSVFLRTWSCRYPIVPRPCTHLNRVLECLASTPAPADGLALPCLKAERAIATALLISQQPTCLPTNERVLIYVL